MGTVSTTVCALFGEVLEAADRSTSDWLSGLDIDLDARRGTETQVDWPSFIALCERFESRFDSRKELLEATDRFAAARFAAAARSLRGGFNDPNQMYWMAHEWIRPNAFPTFDGDYEELPNGHTRITISSPADEPAPPVLLEMLQVALVQVPLLTHQSPARVDAEFSEGRATYTIAPSFAVVDDVQLRRALDQRITAHVSDIVIQLDADGVITYASPNLESALGFAPSEVIGLSAGDYLRASDSPILWRRMADHLIERGSGGTQIRTRHRDGSARWLDLWARPAPRSDETTRFIVVARDITEFKSAERELNERYALLDRIATASPDIIYVFDTEQWKISYINDAIEPYLGLTRDEIVEGGPEMFRGLIYPDDRPTLEAFAEEIKQVKDDRVMDLTLRLCHSNGDWRWLRLSNRVLSRFPDGRIRELLGTASDITGLRKTEQALRVSQERYRITSELTSDYSFSVRVDADRTMEREWITDAFTHITGYRPDEMSEEMWDLLVHPDDHAMRREQFAHAIRAGHATHEYRIIRKTGEVRMMREHARVIRNSDGSLHWYGACRDITEQKTAETARLVTEERFAAIAQSSHDVIVEFDRAGKTLYISPNIASIIGIPADEIISKNRMDLIHPDDRGRVTERLTAVVPGNETKELIFRMRNGNGDWRWMDTTATAFRSSDGDHRTVMISRDITERLTIEAERRRLASIVENSSEFIAVFNTEGRILFVNDAGRQMIGFSDETTARTTSIFDCFAPGESQDMRFRVIPAASRSGHWGGDCRLRNIETGNRIETIAHIFRVESDRREVEPVLTVVARDISERITAERLLRESESRHRMLVESAYDLIAEMDMDGHYVYASPNFEEQLGHIPEDLLGQSWFTHVHSTDRVHTRKALHGLAREATSECGPIQMQHADGTWRWMETNLKRYENIRGESLCLAFFRDITGRRQAEEALVRSREELLQSQKMEAVGRLAGGIAHDFNNLLTAIIGYCDLLLEDASDNEDLRSDAAEIMDAANRAAALTGQLLAFSRRQVLVPKVLDLNALVMDVDRLLRRLIGEQIELVTVLDAELPHVKLDPGQLEQLIINLAVNARDAMPDGGKLEIATSTVTIPAGGDPENPGIEAGRYVTLVVSDTGVGMPPMILSKIFEPFFTTKATEKGTGLGLATAYGIIRQSGGEIRAESEVGRGSAFTVYLPWVDSEVEPVEIVTETENLRGNETILLVEDSETLRNLLRRSLERYGYRVLDAPSGIDALRSAVRHDGPIDLLVTDVVLPKMDGHTLASRIESDRPATRTLFISGFADDALAKRGVDVSEITLLQKPFAPSVLLGAVRRMLDDSDNATKH